MSAVEVRGVSKTYRIPHERQTKLTERVLSLFRPMQVELLLALNDVNLQVPTGGFVGIIGANGSGKSTLLKVIAGLLVPDAGEVHVRGTIAPLLELGLGFHPELTARENVTLYGAVLGYPTREMKDRVAAAIAFAELERFRDAKLKSLSSGMVMRLAFATALLADADILLLDEVLAVGDTRFQEKCFGTFTDARGRGKTIVLVSHDLGSIQRLCETVFWLDKGHVVMSGAPAEIVQTYLAASRAESLRRAARRESSETQTELPGRFGAQGITFRRGGLETPDGTPLTSVPAGTRVVLRLTAEFGVEAEDVVFGFGIRQLGALAGHTLYSINNDLLGIRSGRFEPGDQVDIFMPFTAALMNGHYAITVAITERGAALNDWKIHDWITDFVTFSVEGSRCFEGLADLLADFRCEVLSAAPDPEQLTAESV
jgi:ABC-type polysaccharide/polyol phosphate transport system ATPase subunit